MTSRRSSALVNRYACIAAIACIGACAGCSKTYMTLHHAGREPAPAARSGAAKAAVIHVRDLTYSGEGVDHIVVLNNARTEFEHYDRYIWQPDAVERVTSLLRERFEVYASSHNYSVALDAIPRPTLVVDAELQEFAVIADADDCPAGVRVSMKAVAYDPADMTRKNVIDDRVRTKEVKLPTGKLAAVSDSMSVAVSTIIDGIVADVVTALPNQP